MPECAKIDKILNMPMILNMPKFWIWQSYEYDRVLNMWALHRHLTMPECLAWQSSKCILGSKYASILNMKQLHRVLNMPQHGWIHLNWTRICLKKSGFTIINRLLNMCHTIHSLRSLWKLVSTYWEIFKTGQRSKMKRFGKMIIVFNYFCKKCQLKPLRGFWVCVRF